MTDDGICGVCHTIDEENFDRLQIQCDGCNAWYHCSCVNLEEYEIDDIDHYHCDKCVRIHGPSKEKPIRNRHRHDYSEQNADAKPMQSGTYQFVHNLRRKKFPELSHLMICMENGYDFNYRFIESCSFDKPVLVRKIEGLDVTLPPSSMTVDEIEQLINPDYEVDVIDVQRQHSYKMKFKKFLQFYRQSKRKRIYNLISLEFSGERFSSFVKLPSLVEEISWVTQFWPKKFDNAVASGSKELSVLNEHANIRPEVSKFCLIGMRDSYTDFHVDFGGTSVWYHVLWGEKWFYLIEPTDSNLALYEDWSHSTNKSENFFGDEVDRCYMCVLKPGETLFIPTGWIHAVLTPVDSLVFGGNFLHSFNIPLQLRVYEMELKAATPEKFMFPHFELLNWYAGVHLLEIMKDSNDEKVALKPYLSRGIRALIGAMKRWIARNQAKKGAGLKGVDKIESVTCVQLLKSLEKSVAMNEKFISSKKLQKRSSQRPRDLSNKKKLSSFVKEYYSTSKSKTADFEQVKVVPGSFINARSKVDKIESDLMGCPKSPVKISLKPGVWSLPSFKIEQKKPASPPPPPIKLKLSLAEPITDEPKMLPQKVVVEEEKQLIEILENPNKPNIGPEIKPPVVESSLQHSTTEDSIAVSLDAPPVQTTSPRKKVGFSLLDLNKIPSPPASSVVSPDILSTSVSPTFTKTLPKKTSDRFPVELSASSKHEPIINPLSQKLKLKIPKVKSSRPPKSSRSSSSSAKHLEGTHLTGIFGVSKRGRVQKLNQKVFGGAGKSTEFVPELGQCRKDEEFIYPPLIDSDGEEGRSEKKRPRKDDDSQVFLPPGKFSLTTFSEPLKKKMKKKNVQKQQQSQTTSTSLSSDSLTVPVDASSSSSLPAVEANCATTKFPSIHQKSIVKSKKKVSTAKQRLASKLKLHKKMIPTL